MSEYTVAADQLRAFIERVERIEMEIAERNADKKEIYAEAKASGFDVPTIKKLVRMRAQDPHDRAEADALLSLYADAIGMSLTHVHED